MLFIMHGPSGSGKSWLSEHLIAPLAAVRIRSDVERKRIAGMSSNRAADAFGQGLYSPEMTGRTYARLLECAANSLKGGITIIVDAAFLTRSDRRSFRELAAQEGSGFTILSCDADRATMARCLMERRQGRADPSDADVAILARQPRIMEPLDDGERSSTLLVDTTQPTASHDALAAIRHRLSIDEA